MKTTILFAAIILIFGEINLSAQDSLSNGKALNFPSEKYGISIGNSYEFTGIRLNFADQNVKEINGLNITFWLKRNENNHSVYTGINAGVIPSAGTLRFVNLGVIGVGVSQNISGLNIGGLVVGSGGNINGLSISGLVIMSDGENSHVSGVSISGIGIGSKGTINGISMAGVAVSSEKNINGVASSFIYISSKQKFSGLALTLGYLESQTYNGLSISGFSKSDQMNGLSMGIINKTDVLHGVQIGLLNYAKNNPKWLRILPLINMNF